MFFQYPFNFTKSFVNILQFGAIISFVFYFRFYTLQFISCILKFTK